MNVKWVLTFAVALAVAGLVVGVLAGWVGLASGDGADAVSAAASRIGYAVIGVVPLVLFVRAYQGAGDPENAAIYASVGPLLGGLIAVALLGAAGACALFLVSSTQIPAVFAGEDAEALMRANRAGFGWSKLILTGGASVLAALPTALMAHKRAAGAGE